jgi:hypothetical protein
VVSLLVRERERGREREIEADLDRSMPQMFLLISLARMRSGESGSVQVHPSAAVGGANVEAGGLDAGKAGDGDCKVDALGASPFFVTLVSPLWSPWPPWWPRPSMSCRRGSRRPPRGLRSPPGSRWPGRPRGGPGEGSGGGTFGVRLRIQILLPPRQWRLPMMSMHLAASEEGGDGSLMTTILP